MRIHYLQHVPFENLGNIQTWAKAKGHQVTKTVLYYDEELPSLDSFDLLVIMGGPMNVYEERDNPFLHREKAFIKEGIAAGKLVLGVCLGAQLIAVALGGQVTRNPEKEIGWYEVTLTPEAIASPVFRALPTRFMAFHWHGDTFGVPPGAKRMASSAGCPDQAFEACGGKVIGLQFHLESSEDSISRLTKNCGNELTAGRYIRPKAELLGQDDLLRDIYGNLCTLLDALEKLG